MTESVFKTDYSNVMTDYLSKNNYDKNMIYHKCESKKISKNPFFCSRYEMGVDPFDCSTDYKH